jgi:hypothetical protein
MRNVIIGAAVLALAGSASQLPASSIETTAAEVVVQACTRVDGAQLGALPLVIEVGGKTVRFAEWTTADALATDVVGFATQLPADVTFTVQAGERTFRSDSPRWLHPMGVSGPRVSAIESVTFCTEARPATIAQR